MNIKAYKAATLLLAALVVWLAWKYWSLAGQVVTGAFVSHQAVLLRNDLELANGGFVVSGNVRPASYRDNVLHDLDWYLSYYDGHTNALAGSAILGFLRIEREYLVRDAVAYLRKNGTNDFGGNPYEWLKHEYGR